MTITRIAVLLKAPPERVYRGGTELTAVHEDVPPGVSPEDNETGWRMSLAKFARLVEGTREYRPVV